MACLQFLPLLLPWLPSVMEWDQNTDTKQTLSSPVSVLVMVSSTAIRGKQESISALCTPSVRPGNDCPAPEKGSSQVCHGPRKDIICVYLSLAHCSRRSKGPECPQQ